MIDVLVRNEGVQRRVDGAGARIQIEDAMAVRRIHHVLDQGLRPTLGTAQVARLHRAHFVEIKRSESVAFGGTQVAARSFQPEHLNPLISQRIDLRQFRRSVAAAGVREGQILTQFVRSVYETVDARQLLGFVIAPEILNICE